MNRTSTSAISPGTRRVLCIDDDSDYLTILSMALRLPGVVTAMASNAEEGLEKLRSDQYDLILTDIQMPGQSGFEFIRSARNEGCHAPILVLTAQGSIQGAVEALKLGARDYLTKPIDPERLRLTVDELLRDTPPEGSNRPRMPPEDRGIGFEGLLGVAPRMMETFERIKRVAMTDATVLIVGESGTGKELVARAIHARSPRTEGPFVPVHTGAIPRELIASELFGHERGSFTGAVTSADGKFDAAMKGTLFLDEIGTMDLAVQVALLRVLETFRFTRVGGRKERNAEVRVLAATNRDVAEMVREGSFREDLYYRLNVFTVVIPPLRDRPEDVAVIAEHYLRRYAARYNTAPRTLSPSAIERLLQHPWPGNVRELRNVMEQTSLFAPGEEVQVDEVQIVDTHISAPSARSMPVASVVLPPADGPSRVPASSATGSVSDGGASGLPADEATSLPVASSSTPPPALPGLAGTRSVLPAVAPTPPLDQAPPAFSEARAPVATVVRPANPGGTAPLAAVARSQLGSSAANVPDENLVLRFPIGTTVEAAERQLILRTLEVIGGNKQKAARILGISRRCLYNKLATYGISTSSPREDEHPDEHPEPTDASGT